MKREALKRLSLGNIYVAFYVTRGGSISRKTLDGILGLPKLEIALGLGQEGWKLANLT